MGEIAAMISKSVEETFAAARQLAESMPLPAHILLLGDLGAGKTTFTRGLAAGFGIETVDDVSSPTFTLINQYKGRIPIYHIDLYRVEDGQLDGLGLEDIFDDAKAAVIVEWAERLGAFETPGAIRVSLEYIDEGSRRIEMTPQAQVTKR
jgi:tRNA threonylcarbamoyladenosine biosynthesis protein TsaE